MFRITKERYGKFIKFKLINSESKEYVSIIPGFGGNVDEIVLRKHNSLFSILYGDKTYDELITNKWFKGAKLTPFPNRINNGIYIHNGVKYSLHVNFPSQKHAIHGLVYNKSFKIIRCVASKSCAVLIIEYTGCELTGYPFKFTVSVTYTLSLKGLKCTTSVINKDKVQIPVGDGWHPYFKLNCKVDDLFLKIPSDKKISVDGRMIPTGKIITLTKFSRLHRIGRQRFDTGFAVSKKHGIVKTEIENKKLRVTIRVWQESGKNKYNYLQVFIPPSRKSIAIEPMTCNTDAFNNKQGLILLKPKESFSASYGVDLV